MTTQSPPTPHYTVRPAARVQTYLTRADIDRLSSTPAVVDAPVQDPTQPQLRVQVPPRPEQPPVAHRRHGSPRTWAMPAQPDLPWTTQKEIAERERETRGMLWSLLVGMIVLGVGGSVLMTFLVFVW